MFYRHEIGMINGLHCRSLSSLGKKEKKGKCCYLSELSKLGEHELLTECEASHNGTWRMERLDKINELSTQATI